jgi:nucleoside-diphosphate-sugar epimerase
MSLNILWTGSDGFIASYAIQKLLNEGHCVWGIDNFSKYKKRRNYFNGNFFFIETDAKDNTTLIQIIKDFKINILVSAAGIIGGIQIVHEKQFDILKENELITLAAFDACLKSDKDYFQKILIVSSSMVYESTDIFPSKELDVRKIVSPKTTYGFQKLMTEYFAESAYEQYNLNYTIVRPFNVIGKTQLSNFSHVVPDFISRILQGEYPLVIYGTGKQIRHYAYAEDIAEGFYQCIVNKNALNNDFNLSTSEGISVLELAKLIWNKLNKSKEFKYILKEGYKYDVEKNIPDVSKTKNILGFECKTSLSDTLDIIIENVKENLKN